MILNNSYLCKMWNLTSAFLQTLFTLSTVTINATTWWLKLYFFTKRLHFEIILWRNFALHCFTFAIPNTEAVVAFLAANIATNTLPCIHSADKILLYAVTLRRLLHKVEAGLSKIVKHHLCLLLFCRCTYLYEVYI